jgi:Rieske Fe-S protein
MAILENPSHPTRRNFLSLLPLGIATGILASLGAATFRFLRPRIASDFNENWIDVSAVSELSGEEPLSKKIRTERITGWAVSGEKHQVFVIPRQNQVLSAVCPHEGCEVAWDKQTKRFSCPCHESYFGPDGSRLSGPARRGLDQLPSRVQDGKLQVKYQSFENNATEQIKRA